MSALSLENCGLVFHLIAPRVLSYRRHQYRPMYHLNRETRMRICNPRRETSGGPRDSVARYLSRGIVYLIAKRGLGDGNDSITRVQRQIEDFRFAGAVVITFFICWAPFHAQRVLCEYISTSSEFQRINQWLYPVSGCLYYFSTTINPILYNVMSVKYRNAFKETLCSLGNHSNTGIDHSSTRDTSMVCGPGSRRGSQRFTSNYNYQRSIK